ncbi:MAG TPA: tetratricopeptide repeat protein [Candidatus Coprenecus stercoravium]|uniref:Tetratricopeptide repeat protein n=1 Tax=Candidatus Coprenecus stercoravium TaxID=2840735 RepID=A0A9D2KAN0_9BACT|nr:tetratricopeptide repeat protein [Candidatus Coprenecus stercoravium]
MAESGFRNERRTERRLERVRELLDNDMYVAARDEIDRVMSECVLSEAEKSELASYGLICGIRLGSPNLEALMREYTADYRFAPEYMRVRLLYASSLFDGQEYDKALEVLETVDYALLSRTDKEQYLFNRSFCQFRVGHLGEAANGFGMILKGRHTKYTVPSVYYSGYIAYMDKDFDRAVELLSSIRHDDHFGVLCSYYILESKLMLEDYGYVIAHGEEVSAEVGDDMKPKVARIVSQAYYKTDRPEEARKWFDNYSTSGTDITRKDNYYLGIISYSLGSYYTAVEAFSKVVGPEDSLTQSAAMHMANSYLKLKNKHEALKYYKAASELDFDESIREESYFNYAKLAFDVNSDISAFQSYLSLWPKTDRSDEIYSYIAASCLLSKRYKAAINALNNIRRLTPQMDMNLQKAAFLRGLELFERGSYEGACTDFRIALRHSAYNPALALLTRFWLAEACYRSGRYDEAIDIYSSLSQNAQFQSFKESPLVPFGLGYCYFSKGDYASAAEWFYKFLEQHSQDMDLIIEARLRVGDALFMQRNYAEAASVYEEVSIVNYQPEAVAYAAYQSAVSYGLVPDTEKKIDMLEGIVERKEQTQVYSKAVYELGRTYVQAGQADKAERCFKYLLNDVADPRYTGKCLLEIGMIHSNAGDYDEALSYLARIVEDMPLSEDTENALAVIESIYTVLNKPEEYFAYLDRAGLSAVKTSDEKEQMIFNAAEQVYLSGDYQAAENTLKAFVQQYPDGQKTPLAYFYLAESLSSMGRKEEAAKAYEEVMDKGDGSFVELSTLKFAGICYDLEDYGKAASAYEALSRIARLDNNRFQAVRGMMKSYFMDEKYNSALEAAEKLLDTGTLSEEDRTEAQYVRAKSCLSLGRREAALPILKELSGDTFSPFGAEAAFLLIQDTYDAGQFEETENLVYAFAESGTNQSYWLAKAFIVLGDSFAEREDWEQARATFQSIIDGYEPQNAKDDVLEQVKMRIERLDKLAGK